jgi:pimeloyl-ACP methyl ester carboxylesterase
MHLKFQFGVQSKPIALKRLTESYKEIIMRARVKLVTVFLFSCIFSFVFHLSVNAQNCTDGILPSRALSRICIPPAGSWNGDLVIWAHGYVAFNEPLRFEDLNLPDGRSIADVVQSFGYAFATTSYRQNGLSILEGVEDVRELVMAFQTAAQRKPNRTYLVGASEGGIITTLSIERYPELYSGGCAMCGPIGNFRSQMNYWGDFRVLFDYFFPGVLPGTPTKIPQELIDNWWTKYIPAVTAAVAAKPEAAKQLIKVSNAPTDPSDPTTILRTTLRLLWYNVFATNDGIQKLGGNPYDNTTRWYHGSSNDLRLNFQVRRIRASSTALNNMKAYETTGRFSRPLVTLHTTGDEIIPFWHEVLYAGKALSKGNFNLIPIPVERYGHCAFKAEEALQAFGALIFIVTGQLPPGLANQSNLDWTMKQFGNQHRLVNKGSSPKN